MDTGRKQGWTGKRGEGAAGSSGEQSRQCGKCAGVHDPAPNAPPLLSLACTLWRTHARALTHTHTHTHTQTYTPARSLEWAKEACCTKSLAASRAEHSLRVTVAHCTTACALQNRTEVALGPQYSTTVQDHSTAPQCRITVQHHSAGPQCRTTVQDHSAGPQYSTTVQDHSFCFCTPIFALARQ